MKAAKFNTLDYANALLEAGFTQKQANIQAKALFAVVQEQTLTKQDLKELDVKLSTEIKELERETKHGFERVELKIKESELRLLIRLPAMLTVIIGAFGALFKFALFTH